MNVIFRPLETWPRPQSKHRRQAPFKASYASTLQILDRELGHLGAKEIVIQAAVSEDDIRLDGMLRSDARVLYPGIIIAAQTKYGPLKYLCDEFMQWKDNVRGIALTLERLRLAELYGVTKRGEQYTGFRALPMGETAPAAGAHDLFSSADAAAEWLAARFLLKPATRLITDPDCFREAYRTAAKILHPDAPTGSTQDFQRLQAAKELIEKAQVD